MNKIKLTYEIALVDLEMFSIVWHFQSELNQFYYHNAIENKNIKSLQKQIEKINQNH